MGDNRSNSNDSRCWGSVPDREHQGQGPVHLALVQSLEPDGLVGDPLRPDRELRATDARQPLRPSRPQGGHRPGSRGARGAAPQARAARQGRRPRGHHDRRWSRRSAPTTWRASAPQLPVLDALVDELVQAHRRARGSASGVESLVSRDPARAGAARVRRRGVQDPVELDVSDARDRRPHLRQQVHLRRPHPVDRRTKFFERSPARGEVIVFMQPCEPERDYIKRVDRASRATPSRSAATWSTSTARPSRARWSKGRAAYEDNDERRVARDARAAATARPSVARPTIPITSAAPPASTPPLPDDKDFPRRSRRRRAAATPDGRRPTRRGPAARRGRRDQAGRPPPAASRTLHYVVPPGHVFVMGDNRATRTTRGTGARCRSRTSRARRCSSGCRTSDWRSPIWTGFRWPRIGNFVD